MTFFDAIVSATLLVGGVIALSGYFLSLILAAYIVAGVATYEDNTKVGWKIRTLATVYILVSLVLVLATAIYLVPRP